MRLLFAVLRMAAAIAGATAVVVTVQASVMAGEFRFFNLFGYFTIQGNILIAIVFLIAAIMGFTHRTQSARFVWVRAAATTYIAVVGVVYNTLLVNAELGSLPAWANSVLHAIIPLYAVIDWVFFGDRGPLPWKRLWPVLIYPLVWTAATLLRPVFEAQPFIPYPFLNPAQPGGYGTVALYVLAIAVGFIGFGALVWWVSRTKVLKL